MWWLLVIVVAYVAWHYFNSPPAVPRTANVLSGSEPLHIDLEMLITGAPDQVSGYLNEVADRLQHEIDIRRSRARWDSDPDAAPSSPLDFTRLLARSTTAMTKVFADVDRAFDAASAQPGEPEAVRTPFAKLVDGLLDAMQPFQTVRPPATFAAAYREYVAMLRSIYEQLSDWPAQIHRAAAGASGSCEVHLAVRYDAARVERAIEAGAA